MSDTQKRRKYRVTVPFPHRGGHWTQKGQELDLLRCEAEQLVRAGRLEPVKSTKATAADKKVSN